MDEGSDVKKPDDFPDGSAGPGTDKPPSSPSQTVLGKRQHDDNQLDGAPDSQAKRQKGSISQGPEDSLFVQLGDDIEALNDALEDFGSDMSDDSDAEEEEPRSFYDSSTEKRPDHPAFDPNFTQVVQDLEALGVKVQEILDKSKCQNKRVQGCRANAAGVSRAPDPPIMEIGLFGDTGAGKSSLINSVLDMPGLAKAMSGGQSCTHVVTKYCRPFPYQTQSFGVEITYFDLDTIREMFKGLLESYNIFNFTAKKDQDWTEDERLEYKQQSANAIKTFRTIFCKKEALCDDNSAKSWLDTNKKTPEAVIQTLVDWAEEELNAFKKAGIGFRRYMERDTVEEYAEAVEPLLFGTLSLDEPSLWPLVSGVNVGVRGPVVLNYISIADLPGLDDTNGVRVAATERQIDKCDGIWIVAHIDRAITNKAIDGLLGRYAEAFKGNVSVILTRSDAELTEGVIEHFRREKCNFKQYDKLVKEERTLKKMKKRRGSQVANRQEKLLNKKKMATLTAGQQHKVRSELEKFQRELNDCKMKLPEVTAKRLSTLVKIRNDSISKSLQQERQDHMPEGMQLHVLCVSNYHYAGLKGWAKVDGDLMSAEATGIPALRHHVLQMVADAMLQTLEDFIDHKCAVFIEGVALWSRSVILQDPHKLLYQIRESAESAKPKVEAYLETITKAINNHAVEPLLKKQEEFVAHSLKVLEKKKSWHWATLRAFFKKHGNHGTGLMPKESWNQQFIEGANKVTSIEFDTFVEIQRKKFEQLKEELIAMVINILETLEDHPATVTFPMDKIKSMFQAHIEGLNQAAKEHQKAHKKGLRNCKLDATMDRTSAYFTLSLRPAYEEISTFHGTGSKSRSLLHLESYLSRQAKKSPFALMCKKMQAAILKEAKSNLRTFQKTVDKVFQDVQWQFDNMLGDQDEDEGEDELKKELKEFLEWGEARFEDVKMELKRIRRRYGM